MVAVHTTVSVTDFHIVEIAQQLTTQVVVTYCIAGYFHGNLFLRLYQNLIKTDIFMAEKFVTIARALCCLYG